MEKVIIGTRGSKLALWQAHFVKDELQKIGYEADLKIIKTKGDRIQDLSFDKIEGKGFLQGTQSHLNFLPEKQTDFIFTLWAEEWGLLGGVALLCIFAMIFLYGLIISYRCRHNFGRYLALGLTINFSLYVFINIAMVMGLIPVVGAPFQRPRNGAH